MWIKDHYDYIKNYFQYGIKPILYGRKKHEDKGIKCCINWNEITEYLVKELNF